VSINRDLGQRFRLDLMGGRYDYNSSLAATSNSYYVNTLFDVDLGAKMFVESAFTTQRGGTANYNQFTTTLGYRFDNRQAMRRAVVPTSKPQPQAQPEPPAQPDPAAQPQAQPQP